MIRLLLAVSTAFAAVWYSDDLVRAWRSEPVERHRLAAARWLEGERPPGPTLPPPVPRPPRPQPAQTEDPRMRETELHQVRAAPPRAEAPLASAPFESLESAPATVTVTGPTRLAPALSGAATRPDAPADVAEVDLVVPDPLAPDEARRIRCRLGRVMDLARGSLERRAAR